VGGDGFLVGVLGLQVGHDLVGFLLPEPFVVVHERVAVVGALGGHFPGDGRRRSGRGGVVCGVLQWSLGHSLNI